MCVRKYEIWICRSEIQQRKSTPRTKCGYAGKLKFRTVNGIEAKNI